MSYLTGQVIFRHHNKLQELSVYKTQLVFMNNYFPFTVVDALIGHEVESPDIPFWYNDESQLPLQMYKYVSNNYYNDSV